MTAAPDCEPTLLLGTHRELGVRSLTCILSQCACAHLGYSEQSWETPTRRGISYTPTVWLAAMYSAPVRTSFRSRMVAWQAHRE